jgi:hypothetical protein
VLVLSHWWQKKRKLAAPPELTLGAQLLYALGIVALLCYWLGKVVQPPTWLALTSGLAVGLTAYGVLTRAWMLAACGQIFVLVSAVQFLRQLAIGHPSALLALGPIAAIALLSWSTVQWFKSKPESSARIREPLLKTALIYRWAALPMSIAWIFEYAPERSRMIALALAGLVVFLFAGWKKSREALLLGAFFTGSAFAYFWLTASDLATMQSTNLAAILLLLIQQQIAKRLPQNYAMDLRAHGAVIVAGNLTVWWFCTRWVLEQSSGFFLTASWSFLALIFFTCGIVVRERVYRWLGLALLALALGRIVIVDVWRLEMLYRILSFMALGIVLLVLGFVYSKYQEKFREWL